MASGGIPEEVHKDTCTICMKKYRRPKLLSCFHTFCEHCLQDLAGSSPSFPCPACRAPILLPAGGVSALPTYMYIENDLRASGTPTAFLCDVCTHDREATHKCMQCKQRYCGPCRRFHDAITSSQSHRVVPLQPDSQGGGRLTGDASSPREEWCAKHKTQPLILHCTACKSNICIQCKLTSHEGHATEDLADTGAKAKTSLEERLKTLSQNTRSLEGVMAAIGNRRTEIQALRETSERGIRKRADNARRLVDECEGKAMDSLQALHREQMDKLSEDEEVMKHRRAALTAQSDHIVRVLQDDKDADVLALDAQLKDVSLDVPEVSQMLDDFGKEADPYTCEHNPAAINASQLLEHVGVLKKADKKDSRPSTAEASTPASPLPQSAPSVVPLAPACAQKSVTVSEVEYSKNPRSRVVAICTTSNNRVWVKFSPSGEREIMCLLNKDGLLKRCYDVLPGNSMVTVVDDFTLGSGERNGYSWIQADGKKGNVSIPGADTCITRLSKCGDRIFVAQLRINTCYGYKIARCLVESTYPLMWSRSADNNIIYYDKHFTMLDVSADEMYCAALLGKSEAQLDVCLTSSSWKLSSYSFYKQKILDACFFSVGGQEQLVVVVEGLSSLPVLDHTDGCRLVRYLNTGDLHLYSPCRLATDRQKLLWVACNGGKLVLLEF